ncbi:hypothetical protein AVEN_263400-1 [Araneus ventricosus]|uniref:Secreted protein n=1 Tax=Araneus ventricosus TaxID=182803 RepID=A0A4Y2QFF8_ARAVE|nr:hypothetical protein AVEN_263400-1 [Araneus ventricosus]
MLTLCTISLAMLTSRFEATRGFFWDGPRNFEPRSDDDTWAGALPLQASTPRRRGDSGLHTRRIFSGIGFPPNQESSGLKTETLPLGHRGLKPFALRVTSRV